ncbi:MAG: methyltransferase domain-containing protein [Ilumatobacteraceae bacterium]
MSEPRGDDALVRTDPAAAPPVYFDARRELAGRFLFGQGLEIGPLHLPLTVPADVDVRYVDRMKVADLRREYPELADWNLTEADVIDDGELLSTIGPESQDFIVANHFLEHCENPIGTIENHLGKLRPGGVLFYAVPDKRFTFDHPRHVTPLAHMIADYENGPAASRRDHFDDWARFVAYKDDETSEQITARARDLESAGHSIHMHVWTQAEFLQLILAARERFDDAFDIEACARQEIEFMVVLRKKGPLPAPRVAVVEPDRPPLETAVATVRGKARAALGRARRRLAG